jgi:hypothetical protein
MTIKKVQIENKEKKKKEKFILNYLLIYLFEIMQFYYFNFLKL